MTATRVAVIFIFRLFDWRCRSDGEFELTVGKRRAYAVPAEGWRIVSGAEIEAGESVTIVVEH
jgi:hypothetical protein